MAGTNSRVDIDLMAGQDRKKDINLMVGLDYDPLPTARPLTPPPIPEKTSPPILPPKVSEKSPYDVPSSHGH